MISHECRKSSNMPTKITIKVKKRQKGKEGKEREEGKCVCMWSN